MAKWNIVKSAAEGKVMYHTESNGKGPHKFGVNTSNEELSLWPNETPEGFGKGAEVIFDVDQGEYKGVAQYTARNVKVTKAVLEKAMGSGSSDRAMALVAAAIYMLGIPEDSRNMATLKATADDLEKTYLNVEDTSDDLTEAEEDLNDDIPF